jgi:hypothetical protein
MLAVRRHANPGEHQEGAEYVEDPVELLDQVRARRDHDAPHQERPQDAPEQDAVLVPGWNSEEAEDQDEHEDVVD